MRNFQVVLSEIVRDKIDRYIHAYEFFFEKLYEDTGIWSEDQIRENYRKQARERKEKVLGKLQFVFSQEIILGRTSETTHIILFENKVLIVTYSEDENERLRYIEDIIIAERK